MEFALHLSRERSEESGGERIGMGADSSLRQNDRISCRRQVLSSLEPCLRQGSGQACSSLYTCHSERSEESVAGMIRFPTDSSLRSLDRISGRRKLSSSSEPCLSLTLVKGA